MIGRPFHWRCLTCKSDLGADDLDVHNSPDGIYHRGRVVRTICICCPNYIGAEAHPLAVIAGALPLPDPPSLERLAVRPELWNALAARVTQRTDRHALFSVRDRLARLAVVALDDATDAWLAERGFVVNKCGKCGGVGKTVSHRGPADESDLSLCSRCSGTGRDPIVDSRLARVDAL